MCSVHCFLPLVPRSCGHGSRAASFRRCGGKGAMYMAREESAAGSTTPSTQVVGVAAVASSRTDPTSEVQRTSLRLVAILCIGAAYLFGMGIMMHYHPVARWDLARAPMLAA